MIRLPHKGNCKRKQFSRALVVGNYIYMEFMNHKTVGSCSYYGGKKHKRDMTPRPKILKVVTRNELELIYLKDEDGNWKTLEEKWDEDFLMQNMWCPRPRHKKKLIYKAHNIWGWFRRDEIRNIRSMTKQELIEKYLIELL